MESLVWYKQAGFRFVSEDRFIYIDPWEVPEGEPKADIIFITHAHFDHFDPATIERLRRPSTVIVAPRDVAKELEGNIVAVAPHDRRELEGMMVEVVPAYNIEKDYHPKANGWVGYIITIGGMRYYHAGDTDRIAEMREIHADVALLPIGGTYTMDVSDAVAATGDIRPKKAIPMHYGFVVGSKSDGLAFQKQAPVPVEILEPRIPFVR